METFLTPIERPDSLLMKLVYFFTKKQFGKVLTPLKVHSVRLPSAFGMFYGKISKLDKKLILPSDTALMLRVQVARINICLFCIDIARSTTAKGSKLERKLDALNSYGTNPLFTDADRAALEYVSELTKEKKVSEATFKKLSANFSEREICEIVYIVASEHVYNMTNIGLNIHSDMLCDIAKR
ncbi:hypothetical protein CNR22_16515 [Sphingobacteriaceae bacterium]|nr:hypothetical protein CNR22_16515 [Sphingobacteriaceae bacterium]